ncbi:MAG: endo-1,4-beta-xylanase, partial [Verrucomicrobiota bacterium]
MNSLVSLAYKKLWADPALQTRIDEGIRLHRQSDAVIRVTDYAGKPLPGVQVVAAQHDSSFHFGANIFKLGDYADEHLNRDYEDAFCALFNGATVPFYWRTLEPEQGRPRFAEHSVPLARRPPPDRAVKFCEERGLRIHGHTLVWNYRKWAVPDWVPTDPDEAAPLWEKRIEEISDRYGDRIKRWDVLNEPVAHYERRPGGLQMQPDYEAQSFAWAEKHLPADTRLDINETGNAWDRDVTEYSGLIERLLAAGRRVGAIGLQFHHFSDAGLLDILSGKLARPEALLASLDHYARLQLPIHVSEITLTAPDNSPEGLEAQALVARNFYRLWFCHPLVEGITWWNLPDGGA